MPLTGKGETLDGTGSGMIETMLGTRIGESTLIASLKPYEPYPHSSTARGPKLTRQFADATPCPTPIRRSIRAMSGVTLEQQPAVLPPHLFAATGDGTLVAIGARCRGKLRRGGLGPEPDDVADRGPQHAHGQTSASSIAVGRASSWARGRAYGDTFRFAQGQFTRDLPLEAPLDESFVGAHGRALCRRR